MFEAYHGVTAATHQTNFNRLSSQGYRMISLSVYGDPGDARYAARAELDARTWFINPATRMNPNLTYAQVIPCDSAVRGTGIIDASEALPQLLDGFALLDSGAPGPRAAYGMSHAAQVFAFTPDDSLRVEYPSGFTVADWQNDLPKLARIR